MAGWRRFYTSTLLPCSVSAFVSLGCAASIPEALDGSQNIVVSHDKPPPGVAAYRLRAVHGEGCGLAGKRGSREGAEALLRNQAVLSHVDGVLITKEVAPHVRDGCARREYVLEGVGYSSRPGAMSRDRADIPPSPFAESETPIDPLRTRLHRQQRFGFESTVFAPSLNGSSAPSLIQGHYDFFKVFPLSSGTHLAFGLTGTFGEAEKDHCPEGSRCGSKWSGYAGSYGIAGGAAFRLKSARGFPYLMLWLPTLRAKQLLSEHPRPGCGTASICSEFSAANLLLSASADIEWPGARLVWTPHKLIGGGCGMGFGLTYLYGDMATNRQGDLGFFFRIGFNIVRME